MPKCVSFLDMSSVEFVDSDDPDPGRPELHFCASRKAGQFLGKGDARASKLPIFALIVYPDSTFLRADVAGTRSFSGGQAYMAVHLWERRI